MISRWSFSRAQVFDQCQYRAKLTYVDNIPEIPRSNTAANRGTRIHQCAEDFVLKRTNDLAPELRTFAPELVHSRDAICKSAEHNWYFDKNWAAATPENKWLTVIIDLMVWISPQEAVIVDYKTGKRHGNEIKHGKQVQLYSVAAFMKFLELERVHSEIWYTDLNELVTNSFRRVHGMRFLKYWNDKGNEITKQVVFDPNPSTQACRFCPYRTGQNKWVAGTGDCDRNPPDPTELSEEEWHTTLARNAQKAPTLAL